jgi:hypothetical protein
MKIINQLNAAAGSRQTADEYQPAVVPHPVDVIEAIKARYRFQIFPNTAPGAALPQSSVYQSGILNLPSGPIGILHLVMEATGDVAQAVTTDQADAVLDDVAAFMEAEFGMTVAASEKHRSYVSNIVVEFDEAVESYIDQLGGIVRLMEQSRDRTGAPISLKRLAFGSPSAIKVDQVAAIEGAEFLIERRVDASVDANRYFCSAPLSSKRHSDLLNEIEEFLKKR